MRLIKMFWLYFKEAQSAGVRNVHAIVMVIVLMQLLSSNLIRFDAAGRVSEFPIFFLGSWFHFSSGIALLLVGILFAVIETDKHGLRYFFPYLWGDFSQLTVDLKTIFSRRLPEATPGSLAAVVQGLGLGALLMASVSGLGWFFLWRTGAGMPNAAISIHGGLTGIVQAYLVGHGGFGLIHIILWSRARGSGFA